MADFEIRRPVWLHNRVFKQGQEKALQEAGFTDEDKERFERRGDIAVSGDDDSAAEITADDDLHEKTVDELREMARDRGIAYSGLLKDELVEALRGAEE